MKIICGDNILSNSMAYLFSLCLNSVLNFKQSSLSNFFPYACTFYVLLKKPFRVGA